jgi:hypothetical protein
MFTLANLAELVSDLKGDISEPGRTLLAKRLASLIGSSVHDSPENYSHWIKSGCRSFFSACNLTCPERWVPDDLRVSETALSSFCNKWMSVSEFRLKDDLDWKFITPELNGLRVTMIEELRKLAISKA